MSTRFVRRKDEKRSKGVRRKVLAFVKSTEQQPGEEVAKIEDPQEEEKLDERGLPIGEPSTEGKFSA